MENTQFMAASECSSKINTVFIKEWMATTTFEK